MQSFILASASPRRIELLKRFGFDFTAIAADIDEPEAMHRYPGEFTALAASRKALHVAAKYPDQFVLGADTAVVISDSILGKPADSADNEQMLHRLSATKHSVITALSLIPPTSREPITVHETTSVWFRKLTHAEIAWYLASGEGLDKAGGYGIQGLGGALIEKIHGCYYNVVGLPVSRLITLLQNAAPELLPFRI